jgi:hypothetical protein
MALEGKREWICRLISPIPSELPSLFNEQSEIINH